VIRGSLATVLVQLINLYGIMIFVWAIFSWFDHSRGILAEIYRVLDTLVGPFVGLFKRFIPSTGGIDFSPFIAILLLQLVSRLLIS